MRSEDEFYYGYEPPEHRITYEPHLQCTCGHVISPETGEEFFTEHDGTITGCEACGVFRLS